MAGKISRSLINSTAASGSATFYAEDFQTFTIALATSGGTGPTAAYNVKLYLTPDTPDALAYTYKEAANGAVLVFENVTDSDGVPFNFYKLVVNYSTLSNSSGSGATFTAAISAQ